MKKQFIIVLLALSLIAGMAGCKKYNGEKVAQEREQWVTSLQDSIAQIAAARQADSVRIAELRADIELRIQNFSQVNNPRHVEPFYILSSFKNSYPLNSTGVAARVTDNLQFELIAALSGKKFDAVRFSASGVSVTSATIPPDQGLNFTSSDGLTVCSFSGAENTPLGDFVATNGSNPIKMEYLRNGSVSHSINLSDAQKRWISETWLLTSTRHQLDSLESAQILSARKLEILHITLKNATQHEPK